MSGAPPAPALTQRPDPQDRLAAGAEVPSATGRFLGLLRKLIDYGKGLAFTLQQRTPATSVTSIKLRFGMVDVGAIIACITRALMLATALEARVTSHPIRSEATPRVRAPSLPRPRAAPLSAAQLQARLYRLPTPAQVAAAVRRRPAGAVLADICADLGLDCTHPLWNELQWAIRDNGGDPAKLMVRLFKRDTLAVLAEAGEDLPELPAGWPEWRPMPAASGAGPPATGVRTTIAA